MPGDRGDPPKMLRAILTDVQFWIPTVVLAVGVGLLVFIHGK
jgi:hypothetical protein